MANDINKKRSINKGGERLISDILEVSLHCNLLKIDVEKLFDTLHRNFSIKVLEKPGSKINFKPELKFYYKAMTYGEHTTKYFKLKKGYIKAIQYQHIYHCP